MSRVWDIFWVLSLGSSAGIVIWWLTDLFNMGIPKVLVFNFVGWVVLAVIIGLVGSFLDWNDKTYGGNDNA